jgi:hypothetical protein
MRRWVSAMAGLGMLLGIGAGPAFAGGGLLNGTWKGTVSLFDSEPVHVELRITQTGNVFRGTGVGCNQTAVPGCPPGSGNGVVTFRGVFLNPAQAGEFTMRFEPQTTPALLLPGPAAPAPTPPSCPNFITATGSVSPDGESLNFLMRGQDGQCNPFLALINATKD